MDISWWLAEEAPPLRRRPLRGRAEVEVVGGGVTGCSCALTLAEAGVQVRLHEERTVAAGASGRNGGFALRGGAPPYDRSRSELGPDLARQLWRLTERTIDRLEELAGDAFRREGSLRLAADEAERADLRAEFEALRADGFDAEWLDELPPALNGRFFGAIRNPGDGALQPARWIRRLAARAVDAGADVREGSLVRAPEELEAEHVVVALDGRTAEVLPELEAFVRPTRGQVVVTEPLPARVFPCPHSSRRGYDYWQQTPDRRLLVGGRRDRTADLEHSSEETVTPFIQARLEELVCELVGRLPRVESRWAGIWGTTPDLYPLVGPVPGREGVWVAGGYSGHGNVVGLACGDLVARAILGERHPLLGLFDPARALPAAAD
jgi:gamma-glutamylputrescine oxidase